jgi:flagellar biosynthesis regulator FlaF
MIMAENAAPSPDFVVSEQRHLEAHAVDNVTHYFLEIKREWDGAPDFDERLILALRLNRKLWLLFLNELTARNDPKLKEVTDNIFKLARLVDIETLSLMTEPRLETLDRLIDINNNVAAGLRLEPIPPVTAN